MRNIKMLAKDKAKTLLEKTVMRINEEFQREILGLLVDHSTIKDMLSKYEREAKLYIKKITEQE